jgi:Xaa-Pro aminopeptidase
MKSLFDTSFFEGNRKRLINRCGDGSIIVITAAGLMQRSADTTYPFRQDSNFWYLTGIDEPDIVLVMTTDHSFLIVPNRTKAENIFGGTLDQKCLAKKSGIHEVYTMREGWRQYKQLVAGAGHNEVHSLLPSPTKVTGADSFYTHPARRQLAARLRRMTPGIVLKDARRDLMQMRQIKLPEEIRAIRQAIDITNSALTEVQANLGRFTNEMEIEAELDRSFRLHGAGHAYAPIIAAGGNATTLHYIRNNASLASEHSLLLDVGAEVENYAADITRCYAIGTPNKRWQEVYAAVESVQVAAIGMLHDGLSWRTYGQQVETHMGEELQKLGLVQEATPEAIRSYFPHGISHSLGLDVHDVCDYTEIRENMVITVEPGIYIPEEGIGIRIEDDILITKAGAEVLSKPLPV